MAPAEVEAIVAARLEAVAALLDPLIARFTKFVDEVDKAPRLLRNEVGESLRAFNYSQGEALQAVADVLRGKEPERLRNLKGLP